MHCLRKTYFFEKFKNIRDLRGTIFLGLGAPGGRQVPGSRPEIHKDIYFYRHRYVSYVQQARYGRALKSVAAYRSRPHLTDIRGFRRSGWRPAAGDKKSASQVLQTARYQCVVLVAAWSRRFAPGPSRNQHNAMISGGLEHL